MKTLKISSILETNKQEGKIMHFDRLWLKPVKQINEVLTLDLHVNDNKYLL